MQMQVSEGLPIKLDTKFVCMAENERSIVLKKL